MRQGQIHHRAALPPAGMGRGGEGLLQGRRARLQFREQVQSTRRRVHDKGDKVGAMQTFEKGRKSDVSCACHWTVNVAAAKGHGKLYGDVYSVSTVRHLRAAGLAR